MLNYNPLAHRVVFFFLAIGAIGMLAIHADMWWFVSKRTSLPEIDIIVGKWVTGITAAMSLIMAMQEALNKGYWSGGTSLNHRQG